MPTNPYARHKKPLNSEMNVVPYIDVMLVLLIIFMVTTPMLTTGVEIDLPKAQTQNLAGDKELPVIVSMRANGELFLSSQEAIDEPMNESQLLTRLATLAKERTDASGQSRLQVFVNADSNNPYRDIMQLMAGLQSAGITKVGLLTDSTQGNK